MTLSALNNVSINRLVAKEIGGYYFYPLGNPFEVVPAQCSAFSGVDFDTEEVDFCGDWGRAGPIIQENKIAIREYDGWWEARSYIPEYAYSQENPLRAAMIVFLLMRGVL